MFIGLKLMGWGGGLQRTTLLTTIFCLPLGECERSHRLLLRGFICCFHGDHSVRRLSVTMLLLPRPLLKTSLLGVGRAAERLTRCLGDGVAVDAKEPQQLVGFAAAGHLGNRQAVNGDSGLVHYRRAHGLTKPTCGIQRR